MAFLKISSVYSEGSHGAKPYLCCLSSSSRQETSICRDTAGLCSSIPLHIIKAEVNLTSQLVKAGNEF